MKDNIKNINLWESGIKDQCIFITTLEELLTYIEENDIELIFTLHDKQYPNQNIKCKLDQIADQNNISITYTDKKHPIAILKDFGKQILINPTFFNQNIEKLNNIMNKN